MGWDLPRITGPVDQDPFFALSQSIEQKMGRRYRCLPLIPKPGPTVDELRRELLPTDRLVMAIIEPQDSIHLRNRLMKRVRKMFPERAGVFLAPLCEFDFWSEAQAWSDRMVVIERLRPTEGSSQAPDFTTAPFFVPSFASAVQQAERSQGWPVPEDWITRSVQEAWEAMDNGQSFEEATTLPPPKCIHFPWLDSFLASCDQEDA